MTDQLAAFLESFSQMAPVWGLLAILVLMAVESSFIPFPSEVVMIPAGFLAARGELSLGAPYPDLLLALLAGTVGALGGAYVNYFLALRMGEPFLRKYGKYLFISPAVLERSTQIFRHYGDMATFVCRLLPAIRQFISIPAGIAGMNLKRFTFFTGAGAGIWNIILAGTGFYLGRRTGKMDYTQLVHQGKDMIQNSYGWILLGLALFIAAYLGVQHLVMKKKIPTSNQ